METIVFGGGCFWCTEAIFRVIKGVESVDPGYAGPTYKNETGPSDEEGSTGTTPYVESARVVSDPDQIAFPELLQVYFGSHDPTQANGQGADIGPQYRSAVLYTTERQRDMTEHYIRNLNELVYTGVKKIVTGVEPLQAFYVAEDYHKKYFENHKDAGYCQLVIAPKVEMVQNKYKNLIKKDDAGSV